MFTVYVLHAPAHDKIYIGYTADLESRLLSHNELGTKGYTLRYRPWVLVHKEEFDSKAGAMKREKALKTGSGRAFVWNMIRQKG